MSVPELTANDFDGRAALITGAARGLGRAAAERLIELGARVAVNVRDQKRTMELVSELGDRAIGVAGDLAVEGIPEALVGETERRLGRLDIVINNAALPLTTRLERISADEWRHALQLNLTVPFLITKAAVPV